MKVHWLALLLVIGAALIVPTVSAKIVEEKDGYIVTSGDDIIRLPDISRLSSASITQGQTQWYSTSVPAGKPSFNADLYWGNPSNSLALTITAPDATFGPYYDSADGQIDGRISLRISKSVGLTSGTWWSKLYGYQISGTQSYTYTASAS
jgi:hypothetical protein